MFFEVLRNTVIKGDSHTLNTFLDILENSDAGLARLVPRIIQFIAKTVKATVNSAQSMDLNLLYGVMRIAEALILSKYLSHYLENYLHQFMPPILTCCMKENLSRSPTENHWNLRQKSAKIVQLVLDKFDAKFPNVRTKVIRTLVAHLTDLRKSFKTHYGVIVCLKEIGIDALQQGLMSHLETYIEMKLKPFLALSSNSNDSQPDLDMNLKQNVIKQHEAKMVLGAILECLWICMQHQQGDTMQMFRKLQHMFGEALIPFNPAPPECENYFI